MIKCLLHLPKNIVLAVIRVYQKTLSPDHGLMQSLYPGGYCKHCPSCSSYGYAAIHKYGLIRGGYKSILRIIKCNPWNAGGYDPLT